MRRSAIGLAMAGPAAAGDYRAPRNGFGQPDLAGNWSNATLTPQVRSPFYGTRRAQTPQEVKLLEGANAAKDAAGRAATRVTDGASASDNVGAYDRTWIDNGTVVMRVGGEPRT